MEKCPDRCGKVSGRAKHKKCWNVGRVERWVEGTILGTTNKGDPFHYPTKTQDGYQTEDLSGRVIENFHRYGFDAFIVIGGDGSLRIAQRFADLGLPIVCIPKTIDNDLSNTAVTFGFDTAVTTATEALDKLHSTA